MKIRQTAPTLGGIRDDHRARYQFAINILQEKGVEFVLDIGCGVGYGSFMMATAGLSVCAVERDTEAVAYANEHYDHDGIIYRNEDFLNVQSDHRAITAFEIIEHAPTAFDFLKVVNADLLIGSVPNEDVVPFDPKIHNKEHYRHFTPGELRGELINAGWRVMFLGFQHGKRGRDALVRGDIKTGRTIVFVAVRT